MDNESSFERHKKSVGDIGIGELCSADAKRDAIHFACAPVVAGHGLARGEWVNIKQGMAFACSKKHALGIVDPFLIDGVSAGATFWLILNPGSITALRHAWEHPAFGDEVKPLASSETIAAVIKVESERWLREFANSKDQDYDDLMNAARSAARGDYGVLGNDPGVYDIPSEFWDHVEIVTGERVPAKRRTEYFSCSC